jgi:transcriptional regulator with XRE-family HTH domain
MSKMFKTFGETIRKARKEKGISQEELAELCNLHRTYVGSVERGERNISLQNIVKIARALGLTAAELLRDIE